jgi:hypothetical protein
MKTSKKVKGAAKKNREAVAEAFQESNVAVAETETQTAVEASPVVEPAAAEVPAKKAYVLTKENLANRAAATARTSAGHWNKAAFIKVGGAECPRFAPMTWVERDRFMARDTDAARAVKARYDEHMAEVIAENTSAAA